jgi:hypothetical protein
VRIWNSACPGYALEATLSRAYSPTDCTDYT